jgi:hypothetical protein
VQSTARPDKNKAEGVPQVLAALEEDLAELLVSLETYERSTHPERFEALRRHIPLLRDRCRALKSHRAAQSRMA